MNVFFFLLIAALLAYGQSWFFKKWGQRHIVYEREFSTYVCEQGDEIEMVEKIYNYKAIPVPWLRLESVLPASLLFGAERNLKVSRGETQQNHSSFFSLMPYTKITRRHKMVCTKRGVYPLKSVTLTCGDVIGLRSTTKTLQLPGELVVYPEYVAIEDVPLPSHSYQGDVTVKRWIVDDPFMISGTREYRYGDSLNGVNWKATARSGKLQVHQRDFTADHHLMIMLNVEVSADMWKQITDPELVEKGIRYAAALARQAMDQGIENGFASNAQLTGVKGAPVRTEVSSGVLQLEYILDTLARLELVRSVPFDVMLDQDIEQGLSQTDYILITPFVSEAIEERIQLLEQQGNAVRVIELQSDTTGDAANEATAESTAEEAVEHAS